MRLYTYFRSSASFRVRIALNVKGLAYESVATHLRRDGGQHRKAEYRAVNPQALVPTLDDDGAVLTQSLAIVEYLDEMHPLPALLPREPLARARVRMMAQAISCDIHPINNTRVLKYLRDIMNVEQDARDDWCRHWIAATFVALEQWILTFSRDGRYCYGNDVTLADICLLPQVYNARRVGFDLGPYPALTRVAKHLESLAAFAAAAPEAQPDAE
jgi:maleylacetoacetate isomerase